MLINFAFHNGKECRARINCGGFCVNTCLLKCVIYQQNERSSRQSRKMKEMHSFYRKFDLGYCVLEMRTAQV
jgi:hypothetical protein